jgi:S-DNA-T family DNA segregation ATPase FtsK/SpoIIIE
VGFLNPKSGEVFSGPVVTTKTGIVVTTQPARIPLALLIAGKLLQGIASLIWLLAKHWWATLPALIIVYLWLAYDWPVALALLGVIAGLLAAWWRWHRVTFMAWMAYPYRARVRRLVLGRVWQTTMVTARLAVSIDGKLYVPVLRKVRSSRWQDVLTVRMVAGQIASDFARAAERIASPFGARMVKVSFGERTDEVLFTCCAATR